ncbi:MAG: glycoside hydrolase family 127 protein [Clostridiales bacterium]|nr:glycoside hydrolase family 127 protein [Clostridiales bacterium]
MGKVQETLPLRQIKITDGFWSPIQELIVDVVIPYQEEALEGKGAGEGKNYAIDNFRIAAGDIVGEFRGLVFQDSDLAKWLESATYALLIKPDPKLEKRIEELIDLIGRAQEEDGYLNTYFTIQEPGRKWQNLWECHELFCAGQMIEAAIAYKQVTGRDTFLNIAKRVADHITGRFGKGKVRGYPGHQGIEIGLLKLYRITGDKKYLDTAKYFLEERGTEPEYFIEETKNRGWTHFNMDPSNREYAQVHAPVRQQDKAVGHAVRAGYMYTAMADLASETQDKELVEVLNRLWRNIVDQKMYITGGVGATVYGEAYSADYELPNDLVYAETCASVAMIFFARRMLELKVRGEYADIIEKEIYNGVLSGMQLNGKRFFYVNPLEVVPGVSGELREYRHVKPNRQEWYTCACCPPNLVRLYTSLGKYAWGWNEKEVYAHTYLGGSAHFDIAGGLKISCQSNYPWGGNIKYVIHTQGDPSTFTFAIHIPGWCKYWTLKINDEKLNSEKTDCQLRDGYLYIERDWDNGDTVEINLDMEPRRIYSNTKVRANAGCVALQRGPIVYCFEEADNGGNLSALRLPRGSQINPRFVKDEVLGETLILEMDGIRLESDFALYSDQPPKEIPVKLRAIPYYMWGNRGSGAMRVWINEGNA